jgi:hypothetical protein
MYLRQETSHLLADMLCGFDTGVQSNGLHRHFPDTQLSNNFKGTSALSAKRRTPVYYSTNKV